MPADFPEWIERHHDVYRDWLVTQRWFGDKSRDLASVDAVPIAAVPFSATRVWLITATCRFADGGVATYFTPLMDDESGAIVDALDDDAFVTWLAAGFGESRTLEATSGDGGQIMWAGNPGDVDWSSKPARVFRGEQSNTSVMFGKAAVLKLFRKLQPGVNPDSEIVEFLSTQTSFRNAPRYLGGITLRFSGGRDGIELAAVQGFVPNSGDSWRWLVPALSSMSAGEGPALLEAVELLGQRTGELHSALATETADPAFIPEYYDEESARSEQARLLAELALTLGMLRRANALGQRDLQDLEHRLRWRIETTRVLAGLPRIRVHGDYHLGQVLRSGDDFVVIDFEGEPSRTMAERRQKHSPLKDVAGMLRSLDYAVSSARLSPEGAANPELTGWGVNAGQRFSGGYLRAVSAAPIELVPREGQSFDDALDLFVIEKALYETRYELDNRPDWLHIPLGALRSIAARV